MSLMNGTLPSVLLVASEIKPPMTTVCRSRTTTDVVADRIVVLDFGRRDGYLYTKSPALTPGKVQELIGQAVAGGKTTIAELQGKVFSDLLKMEKLTIPEGDALTEEIRDFLRCVRERATPAVSGREGLEAVSVALAVLAAIERASG